MGGPGPCPGGLTPHMHKTTQPLVVAAGWGGCYPWSPPPPPTSRCRPRRCPDAHHAPSTAGKPAKPAGGLSWLLETTRVGGTLGAPQAQAPTSQDPGPPWMTPPVPPQGFRRGYRRGSFPLHSPTNVRLPSGERASGASSLVAKELVLQSVGAPPRGSRGRALLSPPLPGVLAVRPQAGP